MRNGGSGIEATEKSDFWEKRSGHIYSKLDAGELTFTLYKYKYVR